MAELRHTTVSAEPDEIRDALRTAWRQRRGYWTQLTHRHNRLVPYGLFAETDRIL